MLEERQPNFQKARKYTAKDNGFNTPGLLIKLTHILLLPYTLVFKTPSWKFGQRFSHIFARMCSRFCDMSNRKNWYGRVIPPIMWKLTCLSKTACDLCKLHKTFLTLELNKNKLDRLKWSYGTIPESLTCAKWRALYIYIDPNIWKICLF